MRLLKWLSDTAYDADDECTAIGERYFGKAFLDEYAEMREFRNLRPAIFTGVHPHRDRVLAAMKAWGHDTSDLENADDIATRSVP
ncbi:hypothetical protein ACIPSH_35200 [Streptomyces iakyrus]|uniref:hypothetical protein n=1 Tax=Streptomyces iakyrus TaxID=68219 RepID=UPI0037FD6B9E